MHMLTRTLLEGATVAHPPVGDEQKAFNGSCVVARATSKEEVVAQLKEDVYAKAGVWNVDAAVIHPVCCIQLIISHMDAVIRMLTSRGIGEADVCVSKGAGRRCLVSCRCVRGEAGHIFR